MKVESETKFLSNFKATLDAIIKELKDLPKEASTWSEKPGDWNICQIAHHLEDDGDVWGFLIKRAIVTPGARAHFEGFPGNEVWAERLCFGERPLRLSIARIKTYRDSTIDLLVHTRSTWGNTVKIIDENGNQAAEMTVTQVVEMITEHAREHLETIRRIKANHAQNY